jgi:copper transport protein
LSRKVWSGFAAAAAIATALLIGSAGPAAAHAVLQETEPAQGTVVDAAPDEIVLHFSEAVGARFGGVRVFDRDLNRVDQGELLRPDASTVATAVGDLEDGTYIVAWRVISGDSHPIRGAFTFSVGAPSSAAAADDALATFGNAGPLVVIVAGAARGVGYATALALFGALVFLAFAWKPAAREASADTEAALLGTARRWLLSAWLLGLVAVLLLFLTQAAVEAGSGLFAGFSPSVIAEVAGTTFGRVWLTRVALLVLLLPLLLRLSTRGGVLGALLVLTAAVTITPAFWGHAVTTDPRVPAVVADSVHLLAMSAWVGGLLFLMFVLPRGLATVDAGPRALLLSRAVPRFSVIALARVAPRAATGTYLSVVQLTTWRALFASSYGWVLLAKVLGLVVILIFGAFNLRRSVPRLRAAAEDTAASETAATAMRRAVRAEVILTTLVVFLAAALVAIPPPRSSGAGGAIANQFTTETTMADDQLAVLVIPTRVNQPAEAHFTFTTAQGAPDSELEELTLEVSLPAQDIGPFRYEGRLLAPGHFVAQNVTFPLAGTWELTAQVRRGEVDVYSQTFQIPVG